MEADGKNESNLCRQGTKKSNFVIFENYRYAQRVLIIVSKQFKKIKQSTGLIKNSHTRNGQI